MTVEQGPEGLKGLKLTDDEMRALMGAHMRKVADGQAGENPFANRPAINSSRPFVAKVIGRVKRLLGRGNQ